MNQNRSVNNETSDENLFDAFESMMYHELMNNLNFIAFPIETMQDKESITLSRFSGIQMLNFLNTVRYIKMYERGELVMQLTPAIALDFCRQTASKFNPVTSRRNQHFSISDEHGIPVLADMQLTELLWFNLLGFVVKFAPDNSEITIQTYELGEYCGFCINFPESPYTEMPSALQHTSFTDAILRNSGFERTLAVKLLFCDIALKAHNSALKISSANGMTQLEFKMKIALNKEQNTDKSDLIKSIPDLGQQQKLNTLPLLFKIKDTPSYKISILHSLADQIGKSCTNEAGEAVSSSLHTLIDSGNPTDLIDYIDTLIEAFQS